jgi:hypothetical protein
MAESLPAFVSPAVPTRVVTDLCLLDELELRIARRADQLADRCPEPTALNLRCWLLAEAEILRGFTLAAAAEA